MTGRNWGTGNNPGTGTETDRNVTAERRGLIVTLGDRQRLSARVLAGLRGYWEAKRDGNHLPSRADIDPRGLGEGLTFSFVLERVAPGMARFRVAGAHLNDLMGMEVRGMPLIAFFAPPARAQLAEATEAVFAGPAVVSASLKGEAGYGRPALTAQMLMLPLRSDLGDVNRVLGCIVADGEIGRTPRRFEAMTLETEYLGPQPVRNPVSRPLEAGFAEESTPFTPKARAPEEQTPEGQTPEERRKLFRIVRKQD